MEDKKTDRIRARAHEIWVSEGKPDGMHERHWDQAQKDVDASDMPAKAKPKKAAASSAAPKAAAAAAKTSAAAKPSKAPAKAPAKKKS